MPAFVPAPLWTQIKLGMEQVSAWTPEAMQSWQVQRLQRVIGHHIAQDNAYSRHLRDCGIQPHWLPQSTTDLTMLPTIDKEFLRDGQFDRHPASSSDVTIVSTSGSTSVAAAIPHNAASLRVGLGENFARALIAGGIDGDERHWMMGHWEASGQETSPGTTGSFLSMYWMAELVGSRALLHGSLIDTQRALDEAILFDPSLLSSSPNLITRLVNAVKDRGLKMSIPTVLYGGAAATDDQRAAWSEAFQTHRVIAFYPTTDAGAIGVSPLDNDHYQTFTETHFVEVLDNDGVHVGIGERGHLAVTAYESMAAPIIRYRVGDFVTFEGRRNGRVEISDIRRSHDIPIGDALLPMADIASLTSDARRAGHTVRAIQVICRSNDRAGDVLVIRVVGAASPESVASWVTAALDGLPQIGTSLADGSVDGPQFEFSDSHGVDEEFKIPVFLDERRTSAN